MRLHTEIQRALEATGRPWRVCTGGKHAKVYVDDRMVTVIDMDAKRVRARTPLNAVAQIRRAGRGEVAR